MDDTYDKQRLDANWTLGPNNLFFHFLQTSVDRRYRYMLQLEPDVIPLRPLWLEQLHCLASHSTEWVIGSAFLSHCAHDSHTRRCKELGDEIKFHINGNALYATRDTAFIAYWTRAFSGSLLKWPFDLSLHLYARTLPQAAQRRLASRFRAHPFILNYGAEELSPRSAAMAAAAGAVRDDNSNLMHSSRGGSSGSRSGSNSGSSSSTSDVPSPGPFAHFGVLPALRRTSPDSYLVHSSWAMRQLRTKGAEGYAALGLAAPSGIPRGRSSSDGDGEDSSSDGSGEDGSDRRLISLARSLADGQGRLILTFATALYDPLCRNFVAHLRRLGLSSYLLVTFTSSYAATLRARGERPCLHALHGLSKGGGSDVFASRDFFLINSARYMVLTRLLRAGLHIFSADLDVALLRNPLPVVWRLPFDLMLQSDSRDALTLTESSPFLLRDRLHLPNASSVPYVNGGVFFARGAHAVARIFEDTWAMASQDLGTLNEQDCLNRMLLASTPLGAAPARALSEWLRLFSPAALCAAGSSGRRRPTQRRQQRHRRQ